MRLLIFVLAPLALQTGAALAATGITLTSKPSSVTAGTKFTLKAELRKHVALCTSALRLGSSSSQKTVAASGRRVTVTWTVPASAASGTARVSLACPGLGSASASFHVAARAVPASAVVTKSGFSTWGDDQDYLIDWGAVIVNSSPDQDAGSVQVTVNVLDASGHIIGTDVEQIGDIPAGATFYEGGEADSSTANAPPASLQVTTLVQAPVAAAHLPSVPTSNVTFYADDLSGTDVQGQFTNPYSKTMSSLSRITFVAFDGSGNIVGGGYTFTEADVPPGGMLGFSGSAYGVSVQQVAAVNVSVDPDF